MDEKLYVITRTDLTQSQQAVQAGHALAEYLLMSEDTNEWGNGTLVYLKVKDEEELISLQKALECGKVDHTLFREPDFGWQLTAMASLGSNKHFERMSLL